MLTRQVLVKHQDRAQRRLSEYLIISVKYMLQVMMLRCLDSKKVILVSIVKKEPVQNVKGMDNKSLNFNYLLIPMFLVR